MLITRLFPSKAQLPSGVTKPKSVASSTNGDTTSLHEIDNPADRSVDVSTEDIAKPTSKPVDPHSVFDLRKLNTSDHGSNHGDHYSAGLDADLQGDLDGIGVPWNVRLELHKFAREREREAREHEREREAREAEREREEREREAREHDRERDRERERDSRERERESLERDAERQREQRAHEKELSQKEQDPALARLQSEKEQRDSEKEQRLHEDKQRAHELAMAQLAIQYPAPPTNIPGAASVPQSAHRDTFRVDIAAKLAPRFTPDFIEEWFVGLERSRDIYSWTDTQLCQIVNSLLTGSSRQVMAELSSDDCLKYAVVKASLLTHHQLTPESYRVKFRESCRVASDSWSQFVWKMKNLAKRWLQGIEAWDSLDALKEALLLEQFYSKIPAEIKTWLLDRKPTTVVEAGRLVDEYVAIRKTGTVTSASENVTPVNSNFRQSTSPSGKRKQFNRFSKGKSAAPPAHSAAPATQSPVVSQFKQNVTGSPTKSNLFCTYCKRSGHAKDTCSKLAAKNKGSGVIPSHTLLVQSTSTMTDDVCVLAPHRQTLPSDQVHPMFQPFCSTGQIVSGDGSTFDISILRDSGALQSLLLESAVPPYAYRSTGEVRLIEGVTKGVEEIPLVEVQLESEPFSGSFLCGLVAKLPVGVQFLAGNDIYFQCHTSSDEDIVDAIVTRSMSRQIAQPSVSKSDYVPADQDDSILDLKLPIVFSNVKSSSKRSQVVSTTDSVVVDNSTNTGVDLSLLNITNKDDLVKLQKADITLKRLFQQVVDSPSPNSTKPYYYAKDGVLMHHALDKKRVTSFEQIVVPHVLRDKLIYVAHDIPAAGHLAVAKTKARLKPHFFWPKQAKDVAKYCKTCHICQGIGKGIHPKVVPMVPVPVLGEPFQRLAIDIVGPLPICTKSQNRFILTAIDLATHYPIAIALPNHTAQTVAKALVTIFSQFGFVSEILSDRGTDFLSDLMETFLKEFEIRHIKCSAFHPQSNGCLERFHRTLKSMLRALADKFPDAWDDALPWVLFSYRECPVETLGFSPFELVYSFPVRGPLALIKSVWNGKTEESSNRPNVIAFMTQVREQMREARDIALDTAKQARVKSKQWYDREARMRTFEPGDLVMILLPRPGHPLEAKYKGPYKVLERIGTVDYRIATPSKRKPSRVCHVNMLKPYFEREWENTIVNNCVIVDHTLSAVEPDVDDIGPFTDHKSDQFALDHLTVEQQQQLSSLLKSFGRVFNDFPGKTNLVKHTIELKPNTRPVRLMPYRCNPEKAELVKKEIEEMKKMGVIEDSSSPWSSPIVLIPKQDGSWRFCVDYRKVNSVTVADAFPLPRIDDLIDRIGSARFLTKIDLSRGYWQVPLDEESAPVSAFVTPFGLFQWKYMPFGLCNAPATFQKLVAKVIAGLEQFVGAYLDDIIIFSNTWSDHIKHIKSVLQRIQNAGLTIKRSKCVFASASVEYLGHVVGLNKVQPRQIKVEAILHFPQPRDRKQLRSFLGAAGYYRRFIPHFAQLSVALTDMLRKGSRFVWSEDAQKAFLDLKSRLASQPILRPPDFKLPFALAVDASDRAVGGFLFQVVDGVEHPLCFYSKRLNIHQQRYSTVEKEAFALISTTRAFSVYFGTQPVVVYTDHSPLQFLHKMANCNQKLLRWSLELAQYNLQIRHRPGSKNLIPDLLSRPSADNL